MIVFWIGVGLGTYLGWGAHRALFRKVRDHLFK